MGYLFLHQTSLLYHSQAIHVCPSPTTSHRIQLLCLFQIILILVNQIRSSVAHLNPSPLLSLIYQTHIILSLVYPYLSPIPMSWVHHFHYPLLRHHYPQVLSLMYLLNLYHQTLSPILSLLHQASILCLSLVLRLMYLTILLSTLVSQTHLLHPYLVLTQMPLSSSLAQTSLVCLCRIHRTTALPAFHIFHWELPQQLLRGDLSTTAIGSPKSGTRVFYQQTKIGLVVLCL